MQMPTVESERPIRERRGLGRVGPLEGKMGPERNSPAPCPGREADVIANLFMGVLIFPNSEP